MKILVTGGAGFIGTNLIEFLVKGGHEVTSIDNYSLGFKSNHIKGAEYIELDVNDISKLDNDYHLVYHLAALSRVQPSFNKPSETFHSNVNGTQKVCEFVRLCNAKLVYAGSSSRHGDPSSSPYAFTKHLGEEICHLYRRTYGLDIEVARFYNVYGRREILDGEYAAVVGKWRTQIDEGKPITIVGDGEQKRDFTHVDDIVTGLFLIGMKRESHPDAWELGTGVNYSINKVYEMFKERFNCDKVYTPDEAGNYRATLRINNDAIERLGWKPTDSLYDYIRVL
jgi:UDP-glucose 4-epimerase